MRLEQLHYFETLIQEGSFTKAAAKLHIAQPSLTASIKAMEKELNAQLVVRELHGISLTKEGEKTLKTAKAISFLYQNLLDDLSHPVQPPSGNIAIAASKFFCEFIMELFLPEFHRQFPTIKARLIESNFLMSPQKLSDTRCKLGVITRLQTEDAEKCSPGMLIPDELFLDARYHLLPLFTDTFGFTVAKTSPLATMTTVYPTTTYESEYYSTLFPFMQSYTSERVLLASSNPQLHIDALLQEEAYCSIPYFAHRSLFAQEEALTYRSYSNNMTITYYLTYLKSEELSAAEQVFIEELQHYLAQMKFK